MKLGFISNYIHYVFPKNKHILLYNHSIMITLTKFNTIILILTNNMVYNQISQFYPGYNKGLYIVFSLL